MVTTISTPSPRCWKVQGSAFLFWYGSSLLHISVIRMTLVKDWWLTPELYLRRPPAYYPEWRLDRVLKRKAEQGVKVYVIVYKEVSVYCHR